MSLANKLVNLRRFEEAYQEALRAVALDRDNSHAWFSLALAALLTDRVNAALRAYKHMLEASTVTPLQEGDFYRDIGLWHLRHSRPLQARPWLRMAATTHHNAFLRIADGHSLDAYTKVFGAVMTLEPTQHVLEVVNRAILTEVMTARLLIAEGNPEQALRHLARASMLWSHLGKHANAVWAYNALIPELAAVRMTGGADDDRIQTLLAAWLAACQKPDSLCTARLSTPTASGYRAWPAEPATCWPSNPLLPRCVLAAWQQLTYPYCEPATNNHSKPAQAHSPAVKWQGFL